MDGAALLNIIQQHLLCAQQRNLTKKLKSDLFLKHFEPVFLKVFHRATDIVKLRWPIFGVFFQECV